MAHQVRWTKRVLDAFIEKALLNDDEIFIMQTRCKGWTITQQAMHLNISEASVHRKVKLLKDKYDRIQAEYPSEFPVRKVCKEEDYMDSH